VEGLEGGRGDDAFASAQSVEWLEDSVEEGIDVLLEDASLVVVDSRGVVDHEVVVRSTELWRT